jgi:hypothetical protein
MTRRALMAVLCSCACTPAVMTHRFVPIDDSFKPMPREDLSKVLMDADDIGLEPPFKTVGVLEVLGKETDPMISFLAKVSRVGRKYGCDVVVQRDAYQLGNRVPWAFRGRDFQANGGAAWQFLCGVTGADLEVASVTLALGAKRAGQLRDEELGGVAICAPDATSLDYRRRRSHTCANDSTIKR